MHYILKKNNEYFNGETWQLYKCYSPRLLNGFEVTDVRGYKHISILEELLTILGTTLDTPIIKQDDYYISGDVKFKMNPLTFIMDKYYLQFNIKEEFKCWQDLVNIL